MLRKLALLLLTVIAFGAHAQELVLPFQGRWFVVQGGDTPNVNHHMAVRAQWYGVDFAMVGGASGRALTPVEKPSRLEHFYSWNQLVLAPVEGVVTSVVNDLPDNPLGKRDVRRSAGNYVSIRSEAGTFVFLAHLKRGSVDVKVGERLERHQVVGRVGNSGNSDFPHLHMHMQNSPTIHQGEGLNLVFGDMNVELTGKVFESVTWPLIRGLFVEAR
ncbi:M23 family metallopeptidase [Marinobacter sp. 1_MG-2023]|uniref:M23 family metallopeptidase n=1 Tax=Marinobacter sp. 1_MG-2023 TaxID=3062627 RepID=UPI0026E2F2D8|nr:M23 family metallopeptidase [Marinobacter sp. 1_MG-2023]MDO6822856.1 M23 family metallopeptidase [Marinobacter sp. 1_MG-2023]